MTIFPGRVVNGHIEIEIEDVELPEGAEVSVYLRGKEEFVPTPEEEAELEAAIEEADRGGGIPVDEFLRELRELEQKLTSR